jgi:hypothetical protein
MELSLYGMCTWGVYCDSVWVIQISRCGLTIITTKATSSTADTTNTRNRGDDTRWYRHLADTIVIGITEVDSTYGVQRASVRSCKLLLYDVLLPDESIAIPRGWYNAADVAAPLSPLKLPVPVPAIVDIIPVETVTLRIRLFTVSVMYTLPVESAVWAC